mmetsp:Transcript_49152/g.96076  ORF Transcript_49152/g.96076 Transcript_49152/m.96076 type:complete len:246 (-) Transcript_49152:500-1237(-)
MVGIFTHPGRTRTAPQILLGLPIELVIAAAPKLTTIKKGSRRRRVLTAQLVSGALLRIIDRNFLISDGIRTSGSSCGQYHRKMGCTNSCHPARSEALRIPPPTQTAVRAVTIAESYTKNTRAPPRITACPWSGKPGRSMDPRHVIRQTEMVETTVTVTVSCMKSILTTRTTRRIMRRRTRDCILLRHKNISRCRRCVFPSGRYTPMTIRTITVGTWCTTNEKVSQNRNGASLRLPGDGKSRCHSV